MSTQFVKFLATGGIAAAVNLVSRFAINTVASFEIAVAVAYLLGMTTAFLLSRAYVFDASGRSAVSEFKRFAIVNLFALVIVWLVSVGLARFAFPWIGFTWHVNEVAHFIGVFVPAVTSYFGHRQYTFAKA